MNANMYETLSVTENLLLFSGGIESTVLAYKLRKEGKSFRAMFFNLNNNDTGRDLEIAKSTAKTFGIQLEVVDLSSIVQLISAETSGSYVIGEWDSSALSPENEQFVFSEWDCSPSTVKNSKQQVRPSGFPILLSVATYYAQVTGISHIYIGVEGDQASQRFGLEDFCQGWTAMMRHFDDQNREIKLVAPFIQMSKANVISLAQKLGIPVATSWSCYHPGQHHCGDCLGCQVRKAAFATAGVEDTTIYLTTLTPVVTA